MSGPQVQTFEQLFEFMAEKIEAAQGPMLEQQRAMLIADAVYEAAFFMSKSPRPTAVTSCSSPPSC